MSKLLIAEPPLQLLPSLACLIGVNEAIALQRLQSITDQYKLISDPPVGHFWITKTIDEWRLEFPFWSRATVARTFKELRDRGLVIAERIGGKSDPTLSYAIDYQQLAELSKEA